MQKAEDKKNTLGTQTNNIQQNQKYFTKYDILENETGKVKY